MSLVGLDKPYIWLPAFASTRMFAGSIEGRSKEESSWTNLSRGREVGGKGEREMS